MIKHPRLPALALAAALMTAAAHGNTAQVTFNCDSVAIRPSSTTDFFGEDSFLGFTAAEDGSINDELTPVVDSPRSHGTVIVLQLPGLDEPLIEALFLDVPDSEDEDHNHVPDFWEVAREVAGVESLGQFTIDDGVEVTRGTVAAIWSRSAGSTTGDVRIRLRTDLFDLTFQPTFEIWEYQGPLEYEPGNPTTTATVDLARQGADGRFTGTLAFSRTSEVELHYGAADWANELGETFKVVPSTTLFLQNPGAHYHDELVFEDAIPSTPPTLEYALWLLDVVDPNDADGDQIPDLSDGQPGSVSRAPALEVRVIDGQWKLKISAAASQQVTIERSDFLPATSWTEVRTFMLATDVDEVDVPASLEGSGFWRVRSP